MHPVVPARPSGEFRSSVDRAVLVLFASVIESLGWATAALLDQDIERADQVIEDDRQVDRRCDELTGLIKGHLSDATVDPDELEDLIAILQMVPELERSADLAEHIAQRTRHDLGGNISPRSRGLIQSMCDVGIGMWQLTSRAYAERSRDARFQLAEADDELDELSAALAQLRRRRRRRSGHGRGAGAGRPLLRAARRPRRQPGPAHRHHGGAPPHVATAAPVRRPPPPVGRRAW